MVKGNALRHKLWRDIWKNRMQFVAVILLCALGTWVFSGLDAAWRMIELSANTYFEEQQLADLWVTLPRADREAVQRISAVPGVGRVQARGVAEFSIDLPHQPEVRVAAFDGEISINQPLLYEGQALEATDRRGCLLDREFALANGFSVGDRIRLEREGQHFDFIVRGLCLSPEYVSLSKNVLRDPQAYGFALVNSCGLPALPLTQVMVKALEGADLSLIEQQICALYPEALIQNDDSHGARHGVQKDVDMFRNLSYLFPLMAYAVAAMIVLTTITRMLENQRTQMGTLKALGYRDGQMLRHYMSYAFYPSLVGSLIGLYVGRRTLPYVLWSLEEAQFTLPYQLQAPVSAAQWAVCGLGIALACGICYHTYRKSAREETAALLRPKPPKAGKKLMLERVGFVWKRLGFNGKMIVRNLFRNKSRTLMMLMGVLACNMLLIASLGLQDSVIYFTGKYYEGTVRYDLRATLSSQADQIESYRSRIQSGRLEGVMEKSVSVRTADQSRTTLLTVLEDDQRLMHYGENETWVSLPTEGVMLSQKLEQSLNAHAGDSIELWLPGDDEPTLLSVSAIAPITIGQTVMMSRTAWEGIRKGAFLPSALLMKDISAEGLARLNDLDELDELIDPKDQYQDTLRILDSLSQIFMLMSVAALGLAFVVLYNMGILNFAERLREYATLKVLGYHQKEIRHLMSAENNLLTLIGIALSLWPGWWLTGAVMRSCESDTMIFASTVKPVSFIIACVVTYVFSWMITHLLTRKVKNIDMVEALKSVE